MILTKLSLLDKLVFVNNQKLGSSSLIKEVAPLDNSPNDRSYFKIDELLFRTYRTE